MRSVTIKTNRQWRQFKYGYEVPSKILKTQFDYLGEEDALDGFLCYRGHWYHLSDFMSIDNNSPLALLGYSEYIGDSYFSGVLLKLSNDGETYQIATYLS